MLRLLGLLGEEEQQEEQRGGGGVAGGAAAAAAAAAAASSIVVVAKAYRRALVKFHPDRAAQRGLGARGQLEAEETYKLLQNLHEEWEAAAAAAEEDGAGGEASGRGGTPRTAAAQAE
eukprot:COSAG01_NODE_17181_length_1172_cov_3.065238_2_plen_117_part_01